MQILKQGRADTGWQHIYFTTEYETTRNGANVGIRYKVKWAIDNYYYFGFNLVADVWTKGTNYGRQIKANSPNKGSGEALFPSDGGWYWFNNGYTNNNIEGVRIRIYSTNGGTPVFDTTPDRILTAPTGYLSSSISNDINFNIGNNLAIKINDATNIGYTYNLELQVQNADNSWEKIKELDTTSKDFTWDLSSITSTLYNRLSTRNEANTRIFLVTKFNNTEIGTTLKEGKCYVTNSNPNAIDFKILNYNTDTEISSITCGYGPYNDNSNCRVRINQIANVSGKNAATLKEVRLQTGKNLTIIPASSLVGQNYTISLSDPFFLEDEEYINAKSIVTLTVVDSRGNKVISTKTMTITNKLVLPTITSVEFKRDNVIDTKTKLILQGNRGNASSYSNLRIRYGYWQIDSGGETLVKTDLTPTSLDDNNFYFEGYVEGDLGANGFSTGQEFTRIVRPVTNITENLDLTEEWITGYIRVGEPLVHYSKQYNTISIGKKYDPAIGGKLQVDGQKITGGAGVIVEDNLTSNSAVNALSAKQGKALNDSKQNNITGGASTITSSNLTVNRALISDANGKVAVSAVTSIELSYLDGVTSAIQTQINAKATKLDCYPIGAYYISNSNTNPSSLFGGTWVQLTDRFLIGAGGSYANGSIGGASTVTLTQDQMPSHNHGLQKNVPYGIPYNNSSGAGSGTNTGTTYGESYNPFTVLNTGGGQAHENKPPYRAAYMWYRSA